MTRPVYVGELDPALTPDEFAFTAGADGCHAYNDGWTCSRDKDHDGDHMSGAGHPDHDLVEVYALWPCG